MITSLHSTSKVILASVLLPVLLSFTSLTAQDAYSVDASFHSDYAAKVNYDIGLKCAIETHAWVHLSWEPYGGFIEKQFKLDAGEDYPPGSYTINLGPGYDEDLNAWASHHGTCSEAEQNGNNVVLNLTTEPVRSPGDVAATDGTIDTAIIITWTIRTAIPSNSSAYKIYRDGVEIDLVPGWYTSYTDTDVLPDHTYSYAVTTVALGWEFPESSQTAAGAFDEGSTFGVGLLASDGDDYQKTTLEWNDLSEVATDIRIERSKPGSMDKDELAIVNKHATSFTDKEGIAGYNYTYYVTPITSDGAFQPGVDDGYSRPNGKISGHVNSTVGVGVAGIDVYVELQDPIPPGGASPQGSCTTTYCTTTDASGYYEIKDVYYFKEAEFKIYPSKVSLVPHQFEPDTLFRTLSENGSQVNFVDFTDLNVLSVSGRITYSQSDCGQEGVNVLVNGEDRGVITDENGEWAYAVFDEGIFTFEPEVRDHAFENSDGDSATTVEVLEDVVGIDFVNTTERTLYIVAQGGCETSLGDFVEITVSAPGGCFLQQYQTNADGLLTISGLAPRDYSLQVTDVDNGTPLEVDIKDQLLGVVVEIDLTRLDTTYITTEKDSIKTTPAYIDPITGQVLVPEQSEVVHYLDTVETVNDAVRFIYRSPIDIEVDFELAGAEYCGEYLVMEQNLPYRLQFYVTEMNGACPIDSGTLMIYDEISDREGTGLEIDIKDGIALYEVKPGDPDITDFKKFLFILPQIDFAEVEPITHYAVVTGLRSAQQTLVSRSPDIPILVIHDPPGDNSFTTIEKGTSYTTSSSLEVKYGGEINAFLHTRLGPAVDIEGLKSKGGSHIELETHVGLDDSNNDALIHTVTFLETFSTSTSETYIGNDGDVYIGFALNYTFAPTQEVYMDQCTPTIRSNVALGVDGYATTYIYTEYYIKNILLPQLQLAWQDEQDAKKKLALQADIVSWTDILAKNAESRDELATFKENITVSAGADVTRTESSVEGASNTHTFNMFLDQSLLLGLWAELEVPGFYGEVEGGIMATFRTSRTEVVSEEEEKVRTVSYTISDNDIGDLISIDILQDTAYDVPAFRVKGGSTSCPYEHPETQPRELPEIGIFPTVVTNVPPHEAAHFVLTIKNLSPSLETRQYAVKVVPNSNPDGAIVRVAGSLINNGPVTYFFDANQQLDLSMTVERGPLASNYVDVAIMIYSECEYAIWEDGGALTQADTVKFSVNFLTSCTNVSLVVPNTGWVVNQASNNILPITFSGYDLENPEFNSVTLQSKRYGLGYEDIVTIPKTSIDGPSFSYNFNVADLEDGQYSIRARANCGLSGSSYSSEIIGTIDRTSIAPFGIPSPSDGFLQDGQLVSVTFDQALNCNFNSYQPEVTLVRDDTGEAIDISIQCSGDKIILNPLQTWNDLNLDGVLLNAHVHLVEDNSGNVQEYPTDWSFLVNVKPVFWEPDPLAASGLEDQEHVITGVLKNTARLSKAFSLAPEDNPDIISYPEWLTPLQSRGTVLPENDYAVDFAVDPDLTPGLYYGVVTAMVDEQPVSMDVIFEMLASPVYWPFDPNQYQYTMNVVAQFSLDETDSNLSEDSRDMVAAFVNGQVRGVTHVEYVPDLDVYRAFLTVYSNVQGGGGAEMVRFRFWHALNGVEYGALETQEFLLDNTIGSVGNPLILHPEGFFQLIPLHKGWNWISLNLETGDMSREHLLQNLLNNVTGNSITIKSKTQSAQYSPGSGWNGNLSALELGKGYLLHLSNAPDTLRVVGFPATETIDVSVSGNWNWIGFPRLTSEPVNDVLAALTPGSGDILKSQYRFSEYDPAYVSWIGNLTDFTPGQGYKLYLSNPGVVTFEPHSPGYHVDPHLYEFNMNVTGYADLSLIDEPDAENMVVGAFIDGQCRGIGEFEFVQSTGAYRVLMLVHGNIKDLNKDVEFRLRNDITGHEHFANGEQLSFIADGIIGSVDNPYHFLQTSTAVHDVVPEGYQLAQSMPNPTSGLTRFDYTIPEAQRVTLILYDANGQRIRTLSAADMSSGQHSVETDLSDLAAGLYFYELRTNSFTAVRKLIRQ